MGLYRLILAAAVAVSHMDIPIYGYNPGVIAVISFYILSGYVMTMLIKRYYLAPHMIPHFYADRAARLYPQFLLYAVATLVALLFIPIKSPFLENLNASTVALNLSMLPLGYYMLGLSNAMLIPQSWSLGLELTFYLVVPFMLLWFDRRSMLLLAAASLSIFALAYTGKINTDWFGYRLLPGTLFMFMVGMAFADRERFSPWFPVAMLGIAGGLLYLAPPHILALPHNHEVLIGFVIGVLALTVLQWVPFSRFDEALGNISYGLFLNHFIAIWIAIDGYGWTRPFTNRQAAAIVFSSAVAAVASYILVERPVLRWRRRMRVGHGTQAPLARKAACACCGGSGSEVGGFLCSECGGAGEDSA